MHIELNVIFFLSIKTEKVFISCKIYSDKFLQINFKKFNINKYNNIFYV